MKLIEFDNQKLAQIGKFRSKFVESGTLSQQIQKLHNQLHNLAATMAESKNGGVRINFSKDLQTSTKPAHVSNMVFCNRNDELLFEQIKDRIKPYYKHKFGARLQTVVAESLD